MSVHNGAPWVADALRSVLTQTAGDLELIVIDDGSTDATTEILARVGDAPTGGRPPRRRLRRDAAGRAGLRPLDAPEPRHAAREPSRAPRRAPAPARTRLGGARRRPAPRRGAAALAGRAERDVPALVRALRAPALARPGPAAGRPPDAPTRPDVRGLAVRGW